MAALASARRCAATAALVLGAGLSGGACISPSVLDASDRAVQDTSAARDWRPATADDLRGLFGSTSITGPAAAALSKLYYWFEPDGTYTGAALFASPPRFQTLSGTWALDGERLVLDDAPPATLVATDEALRLTGDEGEVVLVREETL